MEAKLKWKTGSPYHVTSGRFTIARSTVNGIDQYVLYVGGSNMLKYDRYPRDGKGWATSEPATQQANAIEFGRLL